MRTLNHLIACFLLVIAASVQAVEIYPVLAHGRPIQLDGFLLDWKQSDSKPLCKDSLWMWNVINTKEGLTGYFKTKKPQGTHGWIFRFLPCKLSSYQKIECNIDSGLSQSFYHVSHSEGVEDSGAVCEWIIPWEKICHDSTGKYHVGLFVFDAKGDTLMPVILTGCMYTKNAGLWSGVFFKSIVLGGLLVALFALQKVTRGKFRKRKKKTTKED